MPERGVVHLRRLEDVRDGQRSLLPRREVHDGQARHILEWRNAGRKPFRHHRHLLARLAEPDEAAIGADGLRRLLDGDAEELIEVAERPHLPRDVSDQPFALERFRERGGRSRTRQREPGLGRQRLHLRKLVVLEEAWTAHGGDDDTHDLAAREHRDEGTALHPGDLVQPLADGRRALRVEDGKRRGFARRRADSGRLVLEVELLTDQALAVATAFARRYDSRAPAAVLDQRQGGEVELEDAGELVEEHDRDSCLPLHVEQPVRERPGPAEPSFGRWRAAPARHEQRARPGPRRAAIATSDTSALPASGSRVKRIVTPAIAAASPAARTPAHARARVRADVPRRRRGRAPRQSATAPR